MELASENGELEPQILDGAIILDETVVSESDMMGNNTRIGEKLSSRAPASDNGEPESQMTGEGPIAGGEDLAAVAGD
jgi:hypothetical protein